MKKVLIPAVVAAMFLASCDAKKKEVNEEIIDTSVEEINNDSLTVKIDSIDMVELPNSTKDLK